MANRSETVTDAAAVALTSSDGGDFSRPTRTTFTVVGAGTIFVGTTDAVTKETGLPISEGIYGSDEGMRDGEELWAIADTGDTCDVRILTLGAKG